VSEDDEQTVFGMDLITLHDGRIMQVHPAQACRGQNCCVHNPSEHPLRVAALTWNALTATMSRVCGHGMTHPDPDDIAFKERILGPSDAWGFGVHTCDGCCRPHVGQTSSVIS
jgi:hypothetical protein